MSGDYDSSKQLRNPYETAGVISRLFFLWPTQLIKDGVSKNLSQEDLPAITVDDESINLNKLVSDEWNKELSRKRPSLLNALFRAFAPKYFWTGIILILESGVKIFQAILLGYFVDIILTGGSSGTQAFNNGYVISALITITGALVGLMHHQYFFYGWRMGMQLRIAVTTLIYDKAIKLSLRSLSHIESSHVVNLSSQDVEAFQQGGIFVHFLYEPIIEAIVILIVGIYEIGLPFIAGFAAIVLLIPLQMGLSRNLTHLRGALGKRTDERIKLVSQALGGARLMKINGWEWAFKALVGSVRLEEMKLLLRINNIKGLNEAMFFAAPVVVGAITFITFSQTGGTLKPRTVFTVLTYYGIVQFTLVKVWCVLQVDCPLKLTSYHIVVFASQCYVAIKRTQALLLLDEMDRVDKRNIVESHERGLEMAAVCINEFSPDDDRVVIALRNFSATWESSTPPAKADSEGEIAVSRNLVLKNVSLEVRKGELIVVVGPVGSAKTSLLMALLGELEPIRESSRVERHGSLAFCTQEPWIMSTTLKSNILFGKPYDEEKYMKALRSCDLLSDLQLLSAGDETVIGDKGVNLSGGQRARVGLARAVYSDSDICLLDDPLSAVDPKVGNTLFQNAVCGELGEKTRVLVTHQVQFLSSECVSRIVVIDSGRILHVDTYTNLQRSGALDWLDSTDDSEEGCAKERVCDCQPNESSTAGLKIGHSVNHFVVEEEIRERMGSCDEISSVVEVIGHHEHSSDHVYGTIEDSSIEITAVDQRDTYAPLCGDDDCKSEMSEVEPLYEKNKAEDPAVGGITVAEDRTVGNVTVSTYKKYFSAMGGAVACLTLLAVMSLGQVLVILSTVWLASWSRQSENEQEQMKNVYIYTGLVVACFVVAIARCVMSFQLTAIAATKLHDRMIDSVLRATILFFDSNPIGRVLNRFSKDMHFVDDMLPFTFYDFVQCALMVLAAIIVVCIGSPVITISLLPLGPYFLYLRKTFLKTSREVKRLDALSRSPVFSLISETLDGLTTIRAYDRVFDFQDIHKSLVDIHTRADFSFSSASRWFGFRLDAAVVVLLAASTFGAVVANQYGIGGSPEALAAGIMYVLQLAGLFQWCIRQSAEMENMMVSVERIVAYSHLPSESALRGPVDISSRPEWPEKGHIVAKDIVCAYRPGAPNVLQGVSFTIDPGERVGVVGRTGAGKSTLMSVILRLLEYEGGTIQIDGVDIKSIGLHDLRPTISVIPQVPFLFSGTIRENMDIFHKYTDAQIWQALECVSLNDVVAKASNGMGLSAMVAENGSNFSVGERQLLCLARAILQNNRILIMDEATANVDLDTDEKVQLAIKKEFSESTVIMVAHRILTVIDCDKVIVMSKGQLAEMDHPHVLLSKYFGDCIENPQCLNIPDGSTLRSLHIPRNTLASMVFETGPIMCRQLRQLAAAAWKAKLKLCNNI